MSAPEAKPQLSDPKEIASIYAQVSERAAKLLKDQMKQQLSQGLHAPSDELGIAHAFMEMAAKMLANPYKLAQTQMELVWDYMQLWQHSMLRMAGMHAPPVAEPARSDNRFKDAQWQENFLFDFIKQSYLIASRRINDAVGEVEGLDTNSRKKVDFFTRQFTDALAPTNFALTNPLVLREIVSTKGENLLKGLNNLLRDLEAGNGQLRVKMTDYEAFELGKNVATSQGKVVFQNDLIQLLQFNPSTKEQHKRPLLIMPPWINKYYILDLREKNSFIKYATDQGHTVFCISWVNPDARLAQKSFDDYLTEGALAAIDAVCRQTGEKEINTIGYCLGGTLLAATQAYMAAKKDKRVASATYFVCLLDFSVPGDLGVFIDEEQITSLEKRMQERGFLEGSEMGTTFNMLRSNDLVWSFVVNNYLMGKEPFPFDLLYWNSDSTRMPFKMHSFYLRNMYLKNLLRVPGAITLDGVPIDLSLVKAPSYFISTVEDHIAPWKGTYLGATALGSPVRFVLGGSGHIAGIVNPPSANKYGYWTNAKAKTLPATPEEWHHDAKHHEGSWWNDWTQWIETLNGGEMVPARDPAKGKLKALEDAPGSFVKNRLDKPA
ncbi:MAG: class I poly(R)-hydroxyalkanoic acid synthase [Proteobacteria bacterium]|nr:class I poly(R)-hydroxyalkanoic acid synthase [Pseudomonadota bacterium]HQR04125.1 class I poly(R)-hydroxyalkanoic acid synthase [Rhodocyclaceae bacterium]